MTKAIVTLKEEQVVADEATMAVVILKGGVGSGFFGHRGRVGEEGGSLPRGLSNASVLLKDNPEHQAKYNKLVVGSYFDKHKQAIVDARLEESLQKQFEVLGYDPLEIIRRGHNRVKMLDDRDFEKQAINDGFQKDIELVVGYIGLNGTITIKCGRWTEHIKNDFLKIDEVDNDPWHPSVGTITHEFGHIVLDNVSFDVRREWELAYNSGLGQHTEYSKKNDREGFSDSYMSYVNTKGISTDPDIQKTFDALRKVIDASRLKYLR